MSYHNERNGWVDNGKKLNNRKCPNCDSSDFVESLSREHCPDCSLECNYWGGGANPVYEQMMEREWAREEVRREAEDKRYYEEHYGESYDD